MKTVSYLVILFLIIGTLGNLEFIIAFFLKAVHPGSPMAVVSGLFTIAGIIGSILFIVNIIILLCNHIYIYFTKKAKVKQNNKMLLKSVLLLVYIVSLMILGYLGTNFT